MKNTAKSVFISAKNNTVKIVVDGNELHGVTEFQLTRTATDKTSKLLVKMDITETLKIAL